MKILFNSDWRECLREHPAEVRLEVYEAVIDYLVTGTPPNLKPTSAMAFSFIKKDIDYMKATSARKSESAKKAIAKRVQTSALLSTPEVTLAEKEELPTEKVEQKELPVEEKGKEKDIDKSISQKKFVKPTVEQVEAYCKERNNNISATSFINFYESKGWMIGSNHMKDWKAAVRTWENHRRYTASSRTDKVDAPKQGTNYEEYYKTGSSFVI